jgi:HlyD family secretion protein
VVIAVNNDSGLLLPGMTAHVNVVVKRKDDVLRLPAVALRFRPSDEAKAAKPEGGAQGGRSEPAAGSDRARAPNGGGASGGGRPPQAQRGARVYRLGEDGKPAPVEIKTGITDNRFVELTGEELKVGDQVILREVGKSSAQDTGTFRMRLF